MAYVFADCELDCERRELRRNGRSIHLEPQVFDVLVHLVRNHSRVVTKDELQQAVWNGRVVSDDALTSRISAARRAIGDSGEDQQLIRTVQRRGFRFVGEVREQTARAGIAAETSSAPSAGAEGATGQAVTFLQTPDGVHLAVASAGSGPPLVKTANWLNHLEFDWQSPVWSPLFQRLAGQCRLIRYDERGMGLSDRDVPDFSFEAWVRDLETVVDGSNWIALPSWGSPRARPSQSPMPSGIPNAYRVSSCAVPSRRDGASEAVPPMSRGMKPRSC